MRPRKTAGFERLLSSNFYTSQYLRERDPPGERFRPIV